MVSKFVWYEIHSSDPEAAKTFYQSLMGWTIKSMDMGEAGSYDMFHNGTEYGLGGVQKLNPATGAPPHWINYLRVPSSVDETCAKVTAAGGNVVAPPFDIPGVGRMAVVSDPQGAYFCPFLEAEGMPPDTSTSNYAVGKGNPVWNELLAADPAVSAAFYCDITGWTSYVADMGTGPYTLLKNEFNEVAGVFKFPEGVSTPAWMTYFEVKQDSMDEALAEVKRLGGQVAMGPMDVPTVGTIGVVADSTGAFFGLIKSAEPPAASN